MQHIPTTLVFLSWSFHCVQAVMMVTHFLLLKHWLSATFQISFANAAESMQSACWAARAAVSVTREKQTNLEEDWKHYHGKKMSYWCHKVRSWENKCLETFLPLSIHPLPPRKKRVWIICLVSNWHKSPRDKNLRFVKRGSVVLWQLHPRGTNCLQNCITGRDTSWYLQNK